MIKPKKYNCTCEFDTSPFFQKIKSCLDEKIIAPPSVNSEYLNRRAKVVDYLRRLSKSFILSEKTFNMALHYLDVILVNNISGRKLKFDITAIGCLLLAVKFVENDPSIPNYADFMNPKKEYYTKEEISNSEKLCLKILECSLDVVSSYDILMFFLVSGVVNSSPGKEDILVTDIKLENEFAIEIDKFYALSRQILDYFNEDVRSLDFSKAEVALASLLLAAERTGRKIEKKVKQNLEKIYNISVESFVNAFFVIRKYVLFFLITFFLK
jgi:hypothetical protein